MCRLVLLSLSPAGWLAGSRSSLLASDMQLCTLFSPRLWGIYRVRARTETEWWNEMLMCSALFLYSLSLLFIYFFFFCLFRDLVVLAFIGEARVPVWWVHFAVARVIWFEFFFLLLFLLSFVNIHVISPGWELNQKNKTKTPTHLPPHPH
jgi:hypothetical protein